MTGLRTKCISTRVTEDEYATLERWAAGRTLSDWARAVLLAFGDRPHTDPILLAELLALRTIVLNVQFALATGDPFTAEEMQRLIARADQDKDRRAQERLASAPPSVVR